MGSLGTAASTGSEGVAQIDSVPVTETTLATVKTSIGPARGITSILTRCG